MEERARRPFAELDRETGPKGDVRDGAFTPSDVEAEKAVLGSMLVSNVAVDAAMALLTEDRFHKPAHRKIWKAIEALSKDGQPVDLVTVADQLKRQGDFEFVQGFAYLTSLDAYVTSPPHVEAYCRIVIDKWTLRQVIEVAQDVRAEAFAQTKDARIILDTAEQKIFEITNRQMRSGFVPMSKLVLAG